MITTEQGKISAYTLDRDERFVDSSPCTPRHEKENLAIYVAADEPPDGGLEAWLCVACAFFLLFCVFGFVTSMGQLEQYYMANQLADYSKPQIAWIATLQSCFTFLFSIFSGRYLDTHGPKGIVIVGSTMSVVSLVCLAFSKKYYEILLSHALCGLSGSVIYAPATAISGHWFKKRRSTAVGIVVCGSGCGGVVYPLMMSQLFQKTSFRDTILVIAGMNGFLMLPAWFFLKSRVKREVSPLKELLKPWSDIHFTLLVIGSAVTLLNFFTPYYNASILMTSNHLPLSEYSVTFLQVGSFVGRAVAGFLADWLGVWTVFTASGLAQGLVVVAFWTTFPLPETVAITGLITYGLMSGAWLTLVSASTAEISPPFELGLRMGLLWTCGAFTILVGPVVCGGITLLTGPMIAIGPALLKRFRHS